MVNNRGISLIKLPDKKGRRHDYDVYKAGIRPVIPKQAVAVVDLGYHGMEKDYPEQLSTLPCKKRRNLDLSRERKKSITKFIQKRG